MQQTYNSVETALLLGVSMATINRLLADGTLPHAKIRGRLIITLDDIARLVGRDRAKYLASQWQGEKN